MKRNRVRVFWVVPVDDEKILIPALPCAVGLDGDIGFFLNRQVFRLDAGDLYIRASNEDLFVQIGHWILLPGHGDGPKAIHPDEFPAKYRVSHYDWLHQLV